MGLFFKNKKESESDAIKASNDNDEILNTKEDLNQVDEWIWVDGYKGTDSDMKCLDYQYQIGNTFVCDTDVKLCDSGFHFCLNLKDVNRYYTLFYNNRFFKVKGLVKKNDIDNYENSHKLAAKEIMFKEEVSKDELFVTLKELGKYNYLETLDDYIAFMKLDMEHKVDWLKNKMMNKFMDLGYSETFSLLLSDKITYVNKVPYSTSNIYAPYYYRNEVITSLNDSLYLKAKALKENNVSADMCAYLLLA